MINIITIENKKSFHSIQNNNVKKKAHMQLHLFSCHTHTSICTENEIFICFGDVSELPGFFYLHETHFLSTKKNVYDFWYKFKHNNNNVWKTLQQFVRYFHSTKQNNNQNLIKTGLQKSWAVVKYFACSID